MASPAPEADRDDPDDGKSTDLATGQFRFRHGDPSPLGTARHQSQTDEINPRQSK